MPNQLQAVLEQIIASAPACEGARKGVEDLVDMARAQQETLRKEVDKYRTERAVNGA